MVRHEIEQRYDDVAVSYVDISAHPEMLSESQDAEIRNRGLFWPVSAINGRIFFDGILTLPRVIKAIEEEKERDARLANA